MLILGIFRESNIYNQLEQRTIFGEERYVVYGEPADLLRDLILRPFGGRILTEEQQHFNEGMSSVRQAVEWGFGKVISLFAFVDFKKN